jgi:hypothetical protein
MPVQDEDQWDRQARKFDAHPVRSTIWGIPKIGFIVVVVMIVFGIIGAGVWAIGVATSGVAGQGNAISQKNSSENWTQQQGRFQQLFVYVRQADEQLTNDTQSLNDFYKQYPNYKGNGQAVDPVLDNLNTLVNAVKADKATCQGNQNDYEALGNTFLAQDFRDHGLPKIFSASDPGWNQPPNNYQFIDYDCVAGTSTVQVTPVTP